MVYTGQYFATNIPIIHVYVNVHCNIYRFQLYAACWTSNNMIFAGGSQRNFAMLVDTGNDEVHLCYT